MNELNISAVDATAMETAATTSAPKHKWLSKLTRGAKKATIFCTIAGVMASACATQAFAAGTGAVDTSSFISTACTVLKSVIFRSFIIGFQLAATDILCKRITFQCFI